MALAYENGSLKGNESDDVNGDDDVFGKGLSHCQGRAGGGRVKDHASQPSAECPIPNGYRPFNRLAMALAYENGSLKGNESDDVNGDDDVFGNSALSAPAARIRHSSRKSKVRMPIANRPLTSDGMDPIPKNYLIRSIAHYDSALSLMHRWSDGAIFIDPNMPASQQGM
ncbi:hypothetical protein MJO28_010001 [Puccinia striiformis f. sp. tritici]|uniref:Uncharacterized protein n=1 Tax=Puccinia striiformis f. sp. tritici TaxID=168172 RepID=A0ACC0E9B9_9BASI|nr:hypothetical protein MJO28_010001 [Puccinia striiformis f. sp. tritici]